MATPIFIATNQTAADVILEQLRLTVPASGTVNLTDSNEVWRIQSDIQLLELITDGTLLINDGSTTFDLSGSLQYLAPVASNQSLFGVEAMADVTDWQNVAAALGGEAGAHANYIFKSDGHGDGYMVPNTRVINNRIQVGTGGDVNYNSIAEAIDAAIAAGASASNVYQIEVYPGTYTEPPMNLVPGIFIVSTWATRIPAAFIVAQYSDQDLFTCTGGDIAGFIVSGVTDPDKCLFRCITPDGALVFHGIMVRNCSTGWHISSEAFIRLNTCGAIIDGPGQAITTWLYITGINSYAGITSPVFISPPSVLTDYTPNNPIQTVIHCANSSHVVFQNGICHVHPQNSTADIFYAETGGFVVCIGTEIHNCGNAFHIGSSGDDTKIIVQSCAFTNNTLNCFIESSTGIIFGNFSTDIERKNIVTGGKLIGMIQYRDDEVVRLIGDVKFRFPLTGKDLDLADYFYDFCSTGASEGGDVTSPGGLFVDVEAGEGFIRRNAPYNDSFWVIWNERLALPLTASATNYIYYDSVDNTIKASLSAPGVSGILLGQAITNEVGIRFLHHSGVNLSNSYYRLNQYLIDTRAVVSKSGLACSEGTTNRKFGIESGSYYFALEEMAYGGSGVDAIWSYFYGTNGITEVTPSTQLNITEYDLSGTLTEMSDGYFRQDSVYLTSDGRISVIYGPEEYITSALAQSSALNPKPTFLLPTGCPIAKIVVEKDVGISVIVDARPIANAAATSGGGGGGGAGSSHSALADLDKPADHLWAMLVNGDRPMTGDLVMGGNSITGAGTIDGVNVSAHASRHNPGAVDALDTGTPVAVLAGASAAAGSASSYSKSDHQHGVAFSTPVSIGTSNSAGSSSSVASANHVHDHGSQTSGTLHAAVIAGSTSGFMTGTDKTKLDGISASAAALTSSAPADVTKSAAVIGDATTAARANHKHDISTAAPTNGLGSSSAEGSATSLSRSDHTHNHGGLRQLIHFIDNGPAEGFATGAYREILPVGDPFPTSVTWYTSSAKIHKIVEKLITIGGDKFPTQIQWNIYNPSDAIISTITDIYDYTGGNLMTPKITRTIT